MLRLQFAVRRLWLATATAAAGYHSSAAVAYAHGGGGASVLPNGLDQTSDAYARNAAAINGLLFDLRARISQALARGGAEAVSWNKLRGKLLPRERIDRLLDPGVSFLELS